MTKTNRITKCNCFLSNCRHDSYSPQLSFIFLLQRAAMKSLLSIAVVLVVVAGPAAAAPDPSPAADANPAPVAAPEPCCGRAVAGGLGFAGVSS